MAVIGPDRPHISILSGEFLAEVRDMDQKNLAIEALRKLLNGEVQSQGKHNVIQARVFSERLDAAIARYHGHDHGAGGGASSERRAGHRHKRLSIQDSRTLGSGGKRRKESLGDCIPE